MNEGLEILLKGLDLVGLIVVVLERVDFRLEVFILVVELSDGGLALL